MAKEKMLVVDDQEPAREMMREFLEGDLGYVCQTAENGLQALNIVERNNFALVITDVRMPEMDGVELLKRVKKVKPDQCVIIMTAFGDNYTFVDMVEAGASDFILKPFDLAELRAKIARVLRERALLTEQRVLIKGLRAKIEELQRSREELQSVKKDLERQTEDLLKLKKENEELRQSISRPQQK
jgi:DNA-binding NtrC family response regulator